MAKMLGAVTKRVAKRAVALSKAKTPAEAELDIGEDRTAIRSRRPKRAASKEPAAKSFREDSLPAVIQDANRCMTTAFPNELPRSAVVIHLVVDNEGGGGRREEGGPCVRRLRRNAFRERQRELGIVVVG